MQVNSKSNTTQFGAYAKGVSNIQSLTPKSLAKLSGDYFKTMDIGDKQKFSNVQLEAISKEALANGFTGDDIKKININLNSLGSALSNKVIAKLNSNHFVGMDDKSALNASQLGSINVESWKGFKSEDIASIAVSKIASLGSNFMTGLTLDQFKGNGGVAVTAFGGRTTATTQTSSVVFSDMTAGQTVELNGLTYTSTAVSTGAEVAAAFASLTSTPTAVPSKGSFTGTFSTSYTSAAATGTGSKTVIFSRTATGPLPDLAAGGTAGIATVTTTKGLPVAAPIDAQPARGLKGDQIEKLSAGAMRAMTSAHINGLSDANLEKLTGLQINSLTATTVGGINSDRFAKLSPLQLNNISHAAMGKVTAAQVSALTDEQIFSWTPAQIGGLSRDGVNGLTKANVTSNFVAADPNAATPVLGVAQTKGLTGDQVSAISPSSISGLSTSVLKQLATKANGNTDSSGLVGSFTNTQIRNFTGNQINSVIRDLNHDQMPAVSTPAINSISTANMAALSVDQIKGLTSAQVSKISLDDVASMKSPQVEAMSDTQIAGFTKTQFAVLYANNQAALGGRVSLFV